MRARRSHPDHDIAIGNFGAIDDGVFLHDAYAEPREVVIALVVHTRHLGRFATDERAAGESAAFDDASDDALGDIDLEFAGGVIVEKEQRLGALYGDVVDAHADEVDTDAIVMTGIDGES